MLRDAIGELLTIALRGGDSCLKLLEDPLELGLRSIVRELGLQAR
jgi:hypothetical protein